MKSLWTNSHESLQISSQDAQAVARMFCTHIQAVRRDLNAVVETWVTPPAEADDAVEWLRQVCEDEMMARTGDSIEPQIDGSWCVGSDAVRAEVLEHQGARVRVRLSQPMFSTCDGMGSAFWQA